MLYDFSHATIKQMSLYDLCNCIVHSYVFVASISDTGLNSILFNTDRERDKFLLEIDAKRLQAIFERIANDDVNSIHMVRDEDGEWKLLKASRTIPENASMES